MIIVVVFVVAVVVSFVPVHALFCLVVGNICSSDTLGGLWLGGWVWDGALTVISCQPQLQWTLKLRCG